jgi:predicted acyltransferase
MAIVRDNPPTAGQQTETPLPSRKTAVRLGSLDVFRGLTILLMLLVNNVALDANTPYLLTHAPWNGGVYLADLVFPWFLLAVGVAIPFAAASFRKKNLPSWRYDLKVIQRSILLFGLGLLIVSSIARRPVFALDVLQLIAMAYLVAALLYDLPTHRRAMIAGFFLVAYWAAIRYLPVPGVGRAIFEEDQNLILHFNNTFLEAVNLRGLLSVIPTSALVMLGSLIGDLFRLELPSLRRSAWLLVIGLGLAVLGVLWNLSLPYNKTFWTPSYILLTAGLGTIVLGIFHYLVDARGWHGWAFPLTVFGSNALFAYVVPILVKVWLLQGIEVGGASIQQNILNFWQSLAGGYGGGWLYTLSYIVFWWLVLWVLYRRRIFLRV